MTDKDEIAKLRDSLMESQATAAREYMRAERAERALDRTKAYAEQLMEAIANRDDTEIRHLAGHVLYELRHPQPTFLEGVRAAMHLSNVTDKTPGEFLRERALAAASLPADERDRLMAEHEVLSAMRVIPMDTVLMWEMAELRRLAHNDPWNDREHQPKFTECLRLITALHTLPEYTMYMAEDANTGIVDRIDRLLGEVSPDERKLLVDVSLALLATLNAPQETAGEADA